jgi:hypothetical protein
MNSSITTMNTMKFTKDLKPQKDPEIAINTNHSITKTTEMIWSWAPCNNEYKIWKKWGISLFSNTIVTKISEFALFNNV